MNEGVDETVGGASYEVDWGLATLVCDALEGLSGPGGLDAAVGREGGTLVLRRVRFKQPEMPPAWLSRVTGVTRARQTINVRRLDAEGRTVEAWQAAATLVKVDAPRGRPVDGTIFERLDALVEELQRVAPSG